MKKYQCGRPGSEAWCKEEPTRTASDLEERGKPCFLPQHVHQAMKEITCYRLMQLSAVKVVLNVSTGKAGDFNFWRVTRLEVAFGKSCGLGYFHDRLLLLDCNVVGSREFRGCVCVSVYVSMSVNVCVRE